MLVLSRRKDEQIIIGGKNGVPSISVTIVEIRNDKVRLGIEAPKNVDIDRREIRESKDRNGQSG